MEIKLAYDVAIVGAGPAGSAAAITAARRGLSVVLFEAGQFPRHKVCGEFVSAEAAEVLRLLLREHAEQLLSAPRIYRSRLHDRKRTTEIAVDPPAYSIPRFVLDAVLWESARRQGIDCFNTPVLEVKREPSGYSLKIPTGQVAANAVVNASGRWSRLNRWKPNDKAPAYLGLKAHFAGATDDGVDLYFFDGGYCGVQAVSSGVLNACALIRQGSAKDLGDVFSKHRKLSICSREWRQITETFATAPVYLGRGMATENGMLQVGDAAGFVDPFVGDGISLALRSGILAGRCAGQESDRYARLYAAAFSDIFQTTRRARALLSFHPASRSIALRAMEIPSLARWVFRRTRKSELDILALAAS